MSPYFTILIPYVDPAVRTEWHPTEATGPFSTLSRGNFPTELDAIQWGKTNLGGTPYTVQLVPIFTDAELAEICTCGHERGRHSIDGHRCSSSHKTTCTCRGFIAADEQSLFIKTVQS